MSASATSSVQASGSRLRASIHFLVAVAYFFLARTLAHGEAGMLASGQHQPLAEQGLLAFLLLIGYASMGALLNRQLRPVSAQGLPLRTGFFGEAGAGLATGWALAVVCVLPMVAVGGIAIVLNLQRSSWEWLIGDAVFFALAALAEEIAFRGYGFQRLVQAVGPLAAALAYAAFYAILQSFLPGSNRASFAVSLVFSLLLSTAYLRSRALWVSWGLNFGWKASRALIFGLVVSGVGNHSPVVQGNPMGPLWLTGGGYGLDGSWFAFAVLLIAFPVLHSLTRELDYRWNTPEIVPGGIAVDLDAAARRQHEAAMGPAEPAPPSLVQIFPVATPAPASVSAPAAPPSGSGESQ